MASMKQPWPGATSLVPILLIALFVCEASFLLQPAVATAHDSHRKLLAQPDRVENKDTKKIATTKESGEVSGSYWDSGGGGGRYNGGGGHWGGGGGHWGGGGGGWNGGGGHWGSGGGGYHRGGSGCSYNGCGGGGWDKGADKTP